MTAEPIAEMVADIRAGRVNQPAAFDLPGRRMSGLYLQRAQLPQPVVDCTAIYAGYINAGKPVDLYDDHPSIVPPWTDSLLAYVNDFGNVHVLQVHRVEHDGTVLPLDEWFTENEVDWSRVRWIAETAIWVGGRSKGQVFPTSGPCHLLRHAINADGSLADINWVSLLDRRGETGEASRMGMAGHEIWDTATVMVGSVLNFLGASNVEVAEPHRQRPIRRRLARTGVTVQAIVVRPPGKRRATSSVPRPIEPGEQLFSPVRGHWARYGVEGREGLLFGKYAGKFWIPPRVAAEPRDYVLKPGSAA
ncbi:MAG: hypothetical protein ABW022_15855 [Actinoplanes sp.]